MAVTKSKYWWAILWLENLRPDWQQEIDKIIQNPYAYCIHDKDIDEIAEGRKPHVHVMVAYTGPTTYKSMMNIFHEFDVSPSRPCVNTCERIKNVRYAYEYLIHNTEDSQRKKKFLYPASSRIEGLNFDIGLLEQKSLEEKRSMVRELSKEIAHCCLTNYLDFYLYVLDNYTPDYEDVVISYSGHFDRLTRGCYLKQKALDECADRR